MDLIINQFETRIRKSGERIVLFNPKTKRKREFPARKLSKSISRYTEYKIKTTPLSLLYTPKSPEGVCDIEPDYSCFRFQISIGYFFDWWHKTYKSAYRSGGTEGTHS